MKLKFITIDGIRYCDVSVDKSSSNGVLHFTHEISVTFVKQDNKWKFDSAWHCGVSDMEWNANEEDSFEATFPGLLDEMRKELQIADRRIGEKKNEKSK